jgi:hypothetical protein
VVLFYSPLIINFKTLFIMTDSKKAMWAKIIKAIVQAAIAALTALGVSSCVSVL